MFLKRSNKQDAPHSGHKRFSRIFHSNKLTLFLLCSFFCILFFSLKAQRLSWQFFSQSVQEPFCVCMFLPNWTFLVISWVSVEKLVKIEVEPKISENGQCWEKKPCKRYFQESEFSNVQGLEQDEILLE